MLALAAQVARAALTVSAFSSGWVASSIAPSSTLVPAVGATLASACAWSVVTCDRQRRSTFSSTARGCGRLQREEGCGQRGGQQQYCNKRQI